MMLKNEDDLAQCWIKYHGALVGYENLIVLDNGSTSDRTLAALEWGARQGVLVSGEFSTAADFSDRGDRYVGLIKQLDQRDASDFWIPLDCDEFLTVGGPTQIVCDRQSLQATLAPHLNSPHPLLIRGALNNHPLRPGAFRWSEQRKTIFAANQCAYLDHGFHYGRTHQPLDERRVELVYVHYHYKPFPLLVEHSKAKLAPYTSDFSRPGLLAYALANKPAYHCVNHLLIDEDIYYASFIETQYQQFPAFADALARVGEELPFVAHADEQIRVTRENFHEAAYLRSNPDVAMAVQAGHMPSGLWHFERHGYCEYRVMRRAFLLEPTGRSLQV